MSEARLLSTSPRRSLAGLNSSNHDLFMKRSEPAPCPFGRCQNHTTYRYRWPLRLEGAGPSLLFVMKNPSCPDTTANQTFRNMEKYARKLEALSLDVVNLYARRTGSSPRKLNTLPNDEAVGPENDGHIIEAAGRADRVIVAWGGASGVNGYTTRVAAVDRLLRDHDLWCVEKPGGTVHPLHPQVWSPSYPLVLWRPAGSSRQAPEPLSRGGAPARPRPELTPEQRKRVEAHLAERRRERG